MSHTWWCLVVAMIMGSRHGSLNLVGGHTRAPGPAAVAAAVTAPEVVRKSWNMKSIFFACSSQLPDQPFNQTTRSGMPGPG